MAGIDYQNNKIIDNGVGVGQPQRKVSDCDLNNINIPLRISSYNCRNLPKNNRSLNLRPDIKTLFDNSSILCLQEIWYSLQELKQLNNLHADFIGYGVAKTDDSDGLNNARGGVAIFYKKDLIKYINRIELNLDWANCIEINMNSHRIIIINVYLPYQSENNRELYIQCLEALKSIIDEMECTSILITGDWNANLQARGRSLFGNLMVDFCLENNLYIVDKELLPDDSYTHVSEAWETSSWIDHVVASADFKTAIKKIDIKYDISEYDHIPLEINIDIAYTPKLSNMNNSCEAKVNWSCFNRNQLDKYCNLTENKLRNIKLINDTFACSNLHCNDKSHIEHIDNTYISIVDALSTSCDMIVTDKREKSNMNKPGWNDHVTELYEMSRETYKLWLNQGKPRYGPIFEMHCKSRLRVKYAIRFIKNHETQLRREALAKKMTENTSSNFWKEIKSINNTNTPLPTVIDGNSGSDKILELWRSHFYDLFNYANREKYDKTNFILESTMNEVIVTVDEVSNAINKLDYNKTCGLDRIYAENLKYCSNRILPLLSICITGFFIHGFLPESMLSVVLVPNIKDKSGNIASKDNYRPIALASIISKVVEIIIMDRIEMCLLTNSNQFGFKPKHGTDQCIYVFKEIVNMYINLNSRVTVCFLDASKAFDKINHKILFEKLRKRGLCGYLLRILVYWYEEQFFYVRWGSLISEKFCVSNGVRQGGILSPYLFNIYMDELSDKLNNLNIGCIINNRLINHLMYADDIVLFCPSTVGLQSMLKICSKYGLENSITFNSKKSAIMSFKPKYSCSIKLPNFKLNNDTIHIVDEYCYLGHIIDKDLSDELDIERQRKKIYCQGNTIIRKFYMCNYDVKILLFKSYCTSLYTPHLWFNYKSPTNKRGSMAKLYTAYHNVLKMFLGMSKFERTSPVCAYTNVPSCSALIRKFIFKFIGRLKSSKNEYIATICQSNIVFTSVIWKRWRELLYTIYNIS